MGYEKSSRKGEIKFDLDEIEEDEYENNDKEDRPKKYRKEDWW